jgi:hypothetical protein
MRTVNLEMERVYRHIFKAYGVPSKGIKNFIDLASEMNYQLCGIYPKREVRKMKPQKCEEEIPFKIEYVDQTENGGYTGDSYSGYIYYPLNENWLIKFHYWC